MPKIIRVDEEAQDRDGEEIQWQWKDSMGRAGYVYFLKGASTIGIYNACYDETAIKFCDIPHLVKALVLAYKHIEGKDVVL